MLTRILTKPVVTATELSENFHKNYPDFSNKISSNYSTLSNQCSTLQTKFNEFCPGICSGITNTKLTIAESYNNGSTYIYSLPTSIGDRVHSYTSMFEPVNYDGSEDREVTRTPPNDNLADNVIALMSDREEIVNHILDLYSCKPTEECFKHYSDDVIFDDPIIYTTGLSNLRAQFYGMYKLFVKSTTISYKILENTPNTMRINLKQRYTLPFVSRAVVQNSEIILEIHEGKITKHIDSWDGKPTGEGGILRKGVAKLVSVFVKVSGN